ncbi:unnamed protein product [Caretta caretta]
MERKCRQCFIHSCMFYIMEKSLAGEESLQFQGMSHTPSCCRRKFSCSLEGQRSEASATFSSAGMNYFGTQCPTSSHFSWVGSLAHRIGSTHIPVTQKRF